MKKFPLKKPALLLCSALPLGQASVSNACTRAVYLGSGDLVITGRSMDWMENLHSRIWLFPKSIKRNGLAGPILSLAVEDGEVYAGDVSKLLKPTKPFDFMPAQ